jgi:hypothetical protein
MTQTILQNYLTSLFGILAGLPVMVLAYFTPGSAMALSLTWTRWLMIIGGVGVVGLGVVAKAFNVHSTTAQAAASQAAVTGDPKAPALVKAADQQVVTGK